MKCQKILACVLTVILLFAAQVSAVEAVTANRVSNTIRFDDEDVSVDAYAINNYTYFKLRDIAYLFNGSNASFSVGYDAASRTISLVTEEAYEPVGGELERSAAATAQAVPATQTILCDGEPVSLDAYAIDGYTYFKIRDLAAALGFRVSWENASIGMSSGDHNDQADAERVLELVNEARAAAGVAPLTMTEELCERAYVRAYEQPQQRGHTRPNGTSCFTVLDGLKFKRAGENVAGGIETPEEVMEGWMNSEGHRENILDAKFTHIGIARYGNYWAQLFLG